uniref:Uncharacterized protein n=1 Tax=Amphimedon queenslandica TaxID=400682 RepID=A0A1X7TV43_AMPQE
QHYHSSVVVDTKQLSETNKDHKLCPNTDDKGVFNTTLSNFIAAKTFGLAKEEIEKISKDAMKYTFDSNDIKI